IVQQQDVRASAGQRLGEELLAARSGCPMPIFCRAALPLGSRTQEGGEESWTGSPLQARAILAALVLPPGAAPGDAGIGLFFSLAHVVGMESESRQARASYSVAFGRYMRPRARHRDVSNRRPPVPERRGKAHPID